MKKQITISVHNGTKVSRAHNMRNRKVTDKEPQVPTLRDERNKLYGNVARAQEALYEAEKPFRYIEHLERRLEAVEADYEALRGFVAGYNSKGVNLLERFEAEKASHEKQTRRRANNDMER